MDEYDDSKLRRQLSDLDEQLDELTRRVNGLPDEFDQRYRQLDAAIVEVRQSLRRELDARADELQSDLDGRIRALRDEQERARAALERRLRWIERHLRATAGADIADLDPTPELVALAQRADRGRTRRAQLLVPESRAAKNEAISAWEFWQSEHSAHRADAVGASRIIASTTPDHPRRPKAEAAYWAARDGLAELASRRDRTANACTSAVQQLARDDALRRTLQDDISDGDHAWVQLTTRLRTRLVTAVERGELLPVWFDTVLGMTPPLDADEWRQAGVELLAYRATYGIDDQFRALGPAPDLGFSIRRRDWHQRLTVLLRDYHY